MDAYQRSHRNYITKLCGTSYISLANSFWLELLRCSTPLSALSPASFLSYLRPFCEQLAKNNPRTGHFACLVTHACDHVQAATRLSPVATEVLNAINTLVLLRGISVQLIALIPPSLQQSILMPPHFSEVADDVLDRLIKACLAYVEATEVNAKTYVLHHTIITFLIVCCSSSLYHAESGPAGDNPFTRALQSESVRSGQVVVKLLSNVVRPPCMEPNAKLHLSMIEHTDTEPSVVATATKLVADVFMAPARAVTGLMRSNSGLGPTPVAETSLSLLLLLLYQDTGDAPASCSTFLARLSDLLNADNTAVDDVEAGIATLMSSRPSVSFSALFESIVETLKQPQSALLLYTLLTRCKMFRHNVLVRSDIDSLIVPLLEQLYGGSFTPVNHLYILLIILLLLSEDDGFSKTVFKVKLHRLSWFNERSHVGLSLGDLMVSVLLKSAFRNTSAAQDEYLHSNALSALINLAPHATHISSATAQRLCFSMEGAYKRLTWLDRKIVESVDRKTYMQERQLLQDFLRNVINTLDIVCYRAMTKNAELVYSLLHQQTMLKALAEDPMWERSLQNALKVVLHFNECVDTAHKDSGSSGEWGVSQVMRVIQHELLSWKRTSLKPVPETRCTYEEAPHARDFFLPYLWSLIMGSSCRFVFPSQQSPACMQQCNDGPW
eukprot:jgi/Ulvmu1/12876/UM098_0064.1